MERVPPTLSDDKLRSLLAQGVALDGDRPPTPASSSLRFAVHPNWQVKLIPPDVFAGILNISGEGDERPVFLVWDVGNGERHAFPLLAADVASVIGVLSSAVDPEWLDRLAATRAEDAS